MMIAMTRPVPPSIVECELTHIKREVIDVTRAVSEHALYEQALAEAGCAIVHVAAAPQLADSVFIEDTAVVLDDLAIITRPGAESRRDEVGAVASALADFRRLVFMQAPATLDGGDVLRIGRRLFVGRSSRTNEDAIRQLREAVEPFGYSVVGVDVPGALHLKSAITAVDDVTVVANPAWVDMVPFTGLEVIHVDASEPSSANVLRVGDQLLVAASAPRLAAKLRSRNVTVVAVEQRELAKAEAGLTCCSLVFKA